MHTYIVVLEPRRKESTPERRDSDDCSSSSRSAWGWAAFLLFTGLPTQTEAEDEDTQLQGVAEDTILGTLVQDVIPLTLVAGN